MVKISNEEIIKEIEDLSSMKEDLVKENNKIIGFGNKIENDKLKAKFLLLSVVLCGMLTLATISTILPVPLALLTTCLTLTTVDKIDENSKNIKEYKKLLIKQENNKQMTELLLKRIDAYNSVYNHRQNCCLSKENVKNVNYFFKGDNRYKEDIDEINNKYNYNNEYGYQKRIGVR